MNRKIGAIFIFLAFVVIVVYFILPASGKASFSRDIKASSAGIYRSMIDQQLWNRWLNGHVHIDKPLHNSADIHISTDRQTAPGNFLLLPLRSDSSRLYLAAELKNYNRFTGYFRLRQLSSLMSQALDSIQFFTENPKNVYGISIIQRSTVDTLLLTSRFTTKHHPDLHTIYSHISTLEKNIAARGARPTGYPMLNITEVDSNNYRCMVALPVNRILDDSAFVRMIPGQFLTTEVTGGPSTITHAHQMMQQYFTDYKRTSMAIPFEYLVTDRIKQPDTAKWITRIYGPVY